MLDRVINLSSKSTHLLKRGWRGNPKPKPRAGGNQKAEERSGKNTHGVSAT